MLFWLLEIREDKERKLQRQRDFFSIIAHENPRQSTVTNANKFEASENGDFFTGRWKVL